MTVRFAFQPIDADPAETVYVDGTEPGFRSLSHWPGNTTPERLRADLSTGIGLAYAALDSAERQAVVGEFAICANNHYDTDGVLSCFAVLHPERALPHAELMLRAAATGDFSTWNGPDALAVDLTVMQLTHRAEFPLARELPAAASDAERWAAGYRWFLDHVDEILDAPYRWKSIWGARHERVCGEIERVEDGDGIRVQRFPGQDLAVVTADWPLTRIALHHAAGDLFRVLLVRPGDDGHRYRFFYRDESWFDTVTIDAAPRVPLDDAVATLTEHEGDGLAGPWWVTDLAAPVTLLGHGDRDAIGNAFFEDPDLDAEAPSRLEPDTVTDLLRDALRR